MSLILLVEDEAAIAEMAALALKHAGHTVVIAADAAAARREVDARLPDLVLLDWMLPGESGLEVARHWRRQPRTKALPIIMLTARGAEGDKVDGLDAGADDYLVKPFSTAELQARIRAVLRRKLPEAAGEPMQVGALRMDPATHRVQAGTEGAEAVLKLGPTEFKLLRVLMGHAERVLSRAQLLDRVWGDHRFIEERTVDVHIKRLREALAPAGAAAMVETVRGAGYRLTARPAREAAASAPEVPD